MRSPSGATVRSFETKHAVRAHVPVLFGIFGPSGSGKTYSALRLAAGIQRVAGGSVHVIDTEARRALHYADRFSFEHIQFDAPFGPLDYLAAIKHCVSDGARTIVIDSMSHEHEGPGGVLEQHDKNMGGDFKKSFQSWAKPKAERRQLINAMIQLPCNFILCFRSKEKTRPATEEEKQRGRKDLVDLGWMPIGGDEYVYEMTGTALLLPAAGGVPTWQPDEPASRAMVKLPEQFRALFSGAAGKPLDEATGEALARWAAGDAAPAAPAGVYAFGGGEHKGRTIREVPADYLTALIDNAATPAKIVKLCEQEIERRMEAAHTEATGSK